LPVTGHAGSPAMIVQYSAVSDNFDTFASRLDQPGVNLVTLRTAWRVWCELVDSPSEGVADELPVWRPDWREQLPRR
jgi:hypothetical protein